MTSPLFYSDDLQALAEIFERVSSRVRGYEQRRSPTVDLVERAKRLLKARRRREAHFGEEIASLLGEPAYDMLLDLYVAAQTGKCVTVSSACIATGAPATTGLRYVVRLVAAGALIREQDLGDRRSSRVWLSPAASAAIERHLQMLEL